MSLDNELFPFVPLFFNIAYGKQSFDYVTELYGTIINGIRSNSLEMVFIPRQTVS
jgi:hypothetical protein